jgi:glyoxylase-like metal-dependent hydrolase (beta-lactamase superfamily II)
MIRSGLALAALVLATSCATTPPSADEAIARAHRAMGTTAGATPLRSLRYSGEGTGYTFGQAYLTGSAWPKVTYHSITRTIDYAAGAMRDEIVLSRAEPLGGGGYPPSGQQRNDQFLSGEIAWNVAGGNVVPGPRFTADRIHQLWITPHGALMAAKRNNATVASADGGGQVLTFTEPGRLRAKVTLDAQGLVTQVDSTFADPVLGDTQAVTRYSDYRSFGSLKFPGRVQQSAGGYPVLDMTVKEVQADADIAALTIPDAARNQAERVTTDKVADGVWFVAGGSHNSVAIEMADHMILVETPLTDARTSAVIDQVKALAPGKPIRYVINSHQHFDHSGGVRAAVAEGATIVTQAANVPYFERTFAQANALRPDRMAQAGKPARFQAVADKAVMSDASRTIELHRIAGGPHTESMLMVWLPKEKLLIEADAFTPGAPNAPPPAVPNPNHLNLIDNLDRLKLPVERILPLHGRVVPAAELYTAAGKPVPAR